MSVSEKALLRAGNAVRKNNLDSKELHGEVADGKAAAGSPVAVGLPHPKGSSPFPLRHPIYEPLGGPFAVIGVSYIRTRRRLWP